jgi:putative endonuclease
LNRQRAEKQGRSGETIAAWWLRLQGWKILGERIKTRIGEVDLIAKRGHTLAFIEVKMRATEASLALAIDEHRLKRVAAAANMLAARYGSDADTIRIDVILIQPWRLPVHMKNVWHG